LLHGADPLHRAGRRSSIADRNIFGKILCAFEVAHGAAALLRAGAVPKFRFGEFIELFRYAALVGFIDRLMHAQSKEEVNELRDLARQLGPRRAEASPHRRRERQRHRHRLARAWPRSRSGQDRSVENAAPWEHSEHDRGVSHVFRRRSLRVVGERQVRQSRWSCGRSRGENARTEEHHAAFHQCGRDVVNAAHPRKGWPGRS
jgi:hypothetical protein